MRFLPVNDHSFIIEQDSLEDTLALFDSLISTPIQGLHEMVPAARTIFIQYDPWQINIQDVVEQIFHRNLEKKISNQGQLVEIPVHYNGEDLAEVAQFLQISTKELIERHSNSEFIVAFTGFAPGFAYLSGGDIIFNVPRRKTPRTHVPMGAVALGGSFSAVYPKDSPGGWQIIGQTNTVMWDLSRSQPALLQPGYRVRFFNASKTTVNYKQSDIGEQTHQANSQKNNKNSVLTDIQSDEIKSQTKAIVIKTAGAQTFFQDNGRMGYEGQGVGRSGAMDQISFKSANRLVGNASTLPVLETVATGLTIQSVGTTVIAVTGAATNIKLCTTEGQCWSVSTHRPIILAHGDTLDFSSPKAGMRCYIAVRGGFIVKKIMGSASTDTLAHVGPEPIRNGQTITIGDAHIGAIATDALEPFAMPTVTEDVVLDVYLGPRTDWFTPASIKLFEQQRFQVTPSSNRIGLRLQGEQPLERSITSELQSEGTALGAIQVPASGQPVLFLSDHPITGGYPVIGCIASHHLALASQIPIGAWIRFNVIRSFQEYLAN